MTDKAINHAERIEELLEQVREENATTEVVEAHRTVDKLLQELGER